MAKVAEGSVAAYAVAANGSPLCWLWVSEQDAALVGVVSIAGNPRNVHAAVHWLGRVRAGLAGGAEPRSLFEALSAEASGEFGQVAGQPVRFEDLAALRRASIATD